MIEFFGSINLVTSWNTAWSDVSGPLSSFTNLMAVVGSVMVVFGIVGYLWERKRGGGGNHQKLIWTIVIGAILSGPSIMIPLLLTLIDYVVNAVISIAPGS